MKNAVNRLASALAVAAVTATAAIAADKPVADAHKFEKAKAYYAQCTAAQAADFEKIRAQIAAFTDAELMAETMNDPEKVAELSVIVNDPHTIHVMASCATEPVMWDTWMRNGTDFNKMTAAMAKAMNPAGMMKWMMAPMNPKMWQAVGAHMDAEKYKKWAVAVANPTFYKPVTNMAEASWYESRLKWLGSAESYSPITNMFSSVLPKPAEASKPAQ